MTPDHMLGTWIVEVGWVFPSITNERFIILAVLLDEGIVYVHFLLEKRSLPSLLSTFVLVLRSRSILPRAGLGIPVTWGPGIKLKKRCTIYNTLEQVVCYFVLRPQV